MRLNNGPPSPYRRLRRRPAMRSLRGPSWSWVSKKEACPTNQDGIPVVSGWVEEDVPPLDNPGSARKSPNGAWAEVGMRQLREPRCGGHRRRITKSERDLQTSGYKGNHPHPPRATVYLLSEHISALGLGASTEPGDISAACSGGEGVWDAEAVVRVQACAVWECEYDGTVL